MPRPLLTVCAGALAVAASAACASRSSPVPVGGEASDLAALAGEWAGEYSSAESGRSGSITFHLVPGRDTAFGDVVMVPSGSTRSPVDVGREGAPVDNSTPRSGSTQVLTIRFVRVAHDSVSGTLDPYRSPECDCTLVTAFTGRLAGDSIAGGFLTRGGGDARSQRGHWVVRRRRP